MQPKSQSPRSDCRLERFNNAARKLRELFKRWDNRLTLAGQSFVEVYKHGRMTVVCDLEIACLRKENGPGFKSESDTAPMLASVVFEAKIREYSELYDWKQKHVFIEDVEFVKCAEGVIPSRIRLYDIHDEVDDLFGGLLYVSTRNGAYKTIPGIVDRKLSVLGAYSSPAENHVANGKIQSTLEVMNSISDDERKSVWNRFSLSDLQNILASIRVMLYQQSVEVTALENLDVAVQVRDVLLGPFNL